MRAIKLSNGHQIPQLGFGGGTAWFKREPNLPFNPACVEAFQSAMAAGFRHLDLAEMYGTDEEVSRALKASAIDRKDLFITHKLYKSMGDVQNATHRMIEQLGVSYLDLLLIHAPFFKEAAPDASLEQAWREMEALVEQGKVLSLGVSNFQVSDLEELMSVARIKPVINQVEFHPYLQQRELLEWCRARGVAVAGYSGLMPLTGKPGGPVDGVVAEIARGRGLSDSQVLLLWGLQQGIVCITTSSKPERMKELLQVAEAAAGAQQPLTDDELARISEAGAALLFRKYWQKQFGFAESPPRPQ